jgi:hypothetical protein
MHGLPLPQGNVPGTHFCAAGRIMSMKSSSGTIGNRTREFPACSAKPQPTAPPRASDQAHRPRNSGHCKEALVKKRKILHRKKVTGFVAGARGKQKKKKSEVVIQARYSGIFFPRRNKKNPTSNVCIMST